MEHTGIQCPRCKDIIFSIARHDFHNCSCGSCHVDGGFDYLSFGWDSKVTKKPKTISINIPDMSEEEYYKIWSSSRLIDPPFGLIKKIRK